MLPTTDSGASITGSTDGQLDIDLSPRGDRRRRGRHRRGQHRLVVNRPAGGEMDQLVFTGGYQLERMWAATAGEIVAVSLQTRRHG